MNMESLHVYVKRFKMEAFQIGNTFEQIKIEAF